MLQLTQRGRTLPGEITATDAKEARHKIRQKGLTAIQIKSDSGGREKQDKKGEAKERYKRQKRSDFKENKRRSSWKRGEDWFRVS